VVHSVPDSPLLFSTSKGRNATLSVSLGPGDLL
jgi:hypothetical protein